MSKRLLTVLVCLLVCVTMLCGCTKAGEETPVIEDISSEMTEPESVQEEPEAEPEPEPDPYLPCYLTGLAQGEDYNPNRRIVAMMVNNIAACRPQRGLSEASILFESKVEGGITRFMALFEDYTKLTGDLGPVRSGRDQFLRLAIPYDALYCHIGRSGITQTYIEQNEYENRDLNGDTYNFIYRDQTRLAQGYALEHTAYTNAELLQQAFEQYGYNDEYSYTGTCYDFVDYREGGVRELTDEAVTSISITHSQSYRTYFDYDETTGKLMMSQYSSAIGGRHQTVDENTGEQLGFDNVLVLFADITTYPYPGGNLDKNGNDKGDPNYQCVDFDYGGLGFYFSKGKMEPIRWFKGATTSMLRFTDMDENTLLLNCGNSYVGIVDLDEYYNFSYAGPDQTIAEEEVIASGEEVELGD